MAFTCSKYEEFKKTTVLEYYKSKSTYTHILFVFVSPKEDCISASLQKHVTEYKIDIMLGKLSLCDTSAITDAVIALK